MRKFLALFLSFLLVLPLSACAAKGETSSDGSGSPNEQYPVTVIDHAGRDVVIEKEPQSIVSCYYITTSLLMALDLDEKIVGIEDNPDYRPIYGLSAPHLLDLPWVGTAKVLDAEGCIALSPDLVILPLRLKDSAEILEEFGIDVLLVDPESQELLSEMIMMVGVATGTSQRAEDLLRFLDEQKAYLESTLSEVSRPRVYLAGNSGLLQTAGDAMYQSDMIRLAGGMNVAAEIEDSYWAEVSYEQLLTWDPEYIILASGASYSVEDVLTDPNLADCCAVKNKQVFKLPSEAEAWDSPVPGSILGSLWLAELLHPDLITDSTAVTDNYYESFYDFTYSNIKK